MSSLAGASETASAGRTLVYFGTYTGGKSQGIYLSTLDQVTGGLTTPVLAAQVTNPSFLALHPSHRFLYAVNEVRDFQGKRSGAVSAFSVEPVSGKLTLLNQQSSGGDGPCHLTVDRAGKHVLVANYGGGSCAALAIEQNGSLGRMTAFHQHKGSSVNSQRQKAPHAHGIYLDAANRFAFVPDLGLDKVLIYKFDAAQGSLLANDPAFAPVAPGSGPRHFAFHPTGKLAYVINEMFCTITAFTYDPARGVLAELQTVSTLPSGQDVQPSYSTAELEVHPSGRFLYGSNRGHDTIAVFAIDESNGKLTLVEHEPTQGKIPRGFGIDPAGAYLLAANQDSDTVVSFRIEADTGRLVSAGHSVQVGTPVCVQFLRTQE